MQTWIVKQVATNLSAKLNTKVTIDRVDISLFNKLLLRDLMVEDRSKDTLLYAGTAKVNITDWFFLKDKATLKYIALEDGIVNLNRTDSVWNYQFLIDYFISPEKKTGKKSVEFDLQEIHLKNIYLNKQDKWIGQSMIASLKKLDLSMESVNFKKKQVTINTLDLDEALFSQSNYKGNRPPQPNLTGILEKIPVISAFKWNNSGWQVALKKLNISNGTFINERETIRAPFTDRFDGQHLLFKNINGQINNVVVNNDTLTADIKLSAVEKSGFQIKKLQSAMRFTPEQMVFNKLDLVTNKSHLRDHFSMSYNAFAKDMGMFVNNVLMQANFTDSELHSDDLAFFAPGVRNWKRIFKLEGQARGTVDNFSVKNMQVRSGNTYINGNLAIAGFRTSIQLSLTLLPKNYGQLTVNW